jgi:IS5 family transposase
MKQTSFASAEYAGKRRQTRRERFLAERSAVVPWARLEALIEPHHPRSGTVGRPPIGVPRMLRMYFLQQWCTLADEALEDALYNRQAMREFIGIGLGRENVPDATTLLKFRRLAEQHDLTASILAEVNAHLTERGLLMRQGTLVDATITAAPSSTKNENGRRDPQMNQTKKGGPAAQGHRLAYRHEARPSASHARRPTQGTVRMVRAAQGAGPGHRRAPVPRHQESVRLPQGQLPWHRQD